MKLCMNQLERNQRELAEQIEVRDRAQRQINFCRLQMKQTREKARDATRDATLKAFVAAMPLDMVEVMPSPDVIYASVTLSAVVAATYRGVPDQLGLTLMEQRNVDDTLGSPILRTYRHGNVRYYVTEQIR